ncbi:MAG: fibronectin type III domain-containing protein [Luteibaculum sp.]
MRIVLVALCLAVISCADPLPEFKNGAPSEFLVSISQVNETNASITWTQSFDPDLDSVLYDVYLNGQAEKVNFRARSYTFTNLVPNVNYTGSVVAKDQFKNSTEVFFTFITNGSTPDTSLVHNTNDFMNLRED